MDNSLVKRQAAIDAMCSACGYDCDKSKFVYNAPQDEQMIMCPEHYALSTLPSAEPETCEYYALCRHGRDENKLRTMLKLCEYCHEDAEGYVKPIEKNNHAFIRFGMNGWELDLKANGWHGSAKIRYCPMCGRDLFVK